MVSLAGSVGLRLLADRVGLTGALSQALKRRSFVPVHDRGQVLVDVAVMIADGGEAIADIDVLRHQGQVLGAVASAPTVWRALDELTPARGKKIEAARARVRRRVWSQLDAVPASKVAGTDLGDVIVLDVDATLVTAHSEKQSAAPNFKGGFGFHPIGVWCDNTTECLALALRPGNAGSNTVTDHIAVLGRAIAQIPAAQLSLLEEADGWRYQAIATNTTTGQLAFIEARHRARVEDRIRHAKDTGLGRFPSREFAINTAWWECRSELAPPCKVGPDGIGKPK